MKIKLYSTSWAGAKTIESSATTYGDLANDLAAVNINPSNMKAVNAETQETLTSASPLDQNKGEMTIMLSPTKNSSGEQL